MGVVGVLASIGMAVGPPLVYADQYVSILRRRDSTGFSKDVCGVLILANVARVYFWLSERFEVALLVQSCLMIAAQFALLYVVVRHSHSIDDAGPLAGGSADGKSAEQRLLSQLQSGGPEARRPFRFWQWRLYSHYVTFVAGYAAFLGLLVAMLHPFRVFVAALGFFALGLESTLPIPQLVTNHRRKSLAGFRLTVLLGWLGGDAFKTVYFILKQQPLQFVVCAIFQLSVDLMIVAQAIMYRHNTHLESLALNDAEEEAAYTASLVAGERHPPA